MVKNPDYFVKGIPRLDAVVEEIGVSDDLQWLKFEAGAIDVSRIPSAEFPYVMKTPRLRALTIHIVDVATDYLGMNCQMKPFDDVRVRRAFNYAIDKRQDNRAAERTRRRRARRSAARPARLQSELEGLSLRSRQGAAPARGGGSREGVFADALDARRSDRNDDRPVDPAGPRAGRRQCRAEAGGVGALARGDSPAAKPSRCSISDGKPIFPIRRISSTCCSRASNGAATTTPFTTTPKSTSCWPRPRR